ncbi:MAG: hypothetical protein ABR518_08685, partial [Actinomycetota bacterium]
MSFRARLTLFFLGIVVVPLGVSTLVVNRIAENQALQQTDSRLVGLVQTPQLAIYGDHGLATRAKATLTNAATGVASDAVRAAMSGPRATRQARLDGVRRESELQYLVVLKGEQVVGSSLERNSFLPDIVVTPRRLVDEKEEGGLVAGTRVLIGESAAVVGGFYLD